MLNLPTLLRRQKELFKQFLELEREIADLDQQIIAAGTSSHAATHAPPGRNSRPRKAKYGVSDSVREILRILQQAGEPLTPRELALRMGVEPKVASRYLAGALKLRLVERLPNFRYRVISAVPTLEARDVQPA
jgi:hypothetical protein